MLALLAAASAVPVRELLFSSTPTCPECPECEEPPALPPSPAPPSGPFKCEHTHRLSLTHTAATKSASVSRTPFSQERPAAPLSALLPLGELSGPCRYDAVGRHERKTDSFMPYMPMKDGWFQTHSTYRFLTVREQVMTAIGEAKHGLWRIHDNGIIRLYRKGGKSGVPLDADVNDPAILDTILSDYAPRPYPHPHIAPTMHRDPRR